MDSVRLLRKTIQAATVTLRAKQEQSDTMNIRLIVLPILAAAAAYAAPVRLRCEFMDNPMGIDAPAPHLSWQSDNRERNWRQSAYRILVSSSPAAARAGKADVWDSGRRESGESIDIAYAGPALASGRRYYWNVHVWDAKGKMSQGAAPAWWEMGLLAKADWVARWIARRDEEAEDRAGIRLMTVAGQAAPVAGAPRPVLTYRTSVEIKEQPRAAALFVAAADGFKVMLNGRELYSKRSWASFDRQDIADRLAIGRNTVEVAVAARAGRGAGGRGATGPAGVAALLKIVYADGSVERYPSGDRWEARLGSDQEWKPAAIAGEPGAAQGNLPQPAALLRREFAVTKRVEAARLYITALGSYRAFINGARVGQDALTPEFTDYRKRVLYQTYDVASLLVNGRNAIGAMLGDGWFLSGLSERGTRLNFLPAPTRLFAQLRIRYSDGTSDTVVTDGSWKASQSPILHSEIYAGETYDARLEQPGWDKPGFNDARWAPAAMSDAPPGVISAQMTTPARVAMTIQPDSVKPISGGSYVFDMGQNMVGWPVLKVNGPAGTTVRLRTAEILNPDGTLYRDNLRNADATDTYVLRGGGEEIYRPYFTFQGFRYVEVTGYPGTPALDSIRGEVVTSVAGEPAAKIATSSALVNRFWKTGIWGQRGNFLSIPTDCPQRDERFGWTGDAEVFWRTGSYNFDIASFGRQWMRSMVDEQSADGAFTNTVPGVAAAGGDGAPGWGDAGVIVPWTAWIQYGDRSIVEENWAAMERWMNFIQTNNPDFLRRNRTGANFADWLPAGSQTPRDLVATAYWALIADQMSQMAHALGKETDAQRYSALGDNIRAAFRKEFIKEDGTVGSGSQTSYTLALYMKLTPESLAPKLLDNLVKDIEAHDWHLTTGFLGTPFLLFTLADHGRTDVAYRLLLNETYPSWGYMLSKGATTWWERWNGDTGDPAMNSYNHYAFGSVVAWVYRYVTGIDTTPAAPGFKEIVIRPRLDARITQARGEYDSAYGKIVTDWNGAAGGPFSMKVTIPANTTATVYLPAVVNGTVTEGGKPASARREGTEYLIRIGSGSYVFEVR
jgi:alpha-L-rhamnosidase